MEADVLGVDLVKVAKLLKEKEIQVEDELLLEKTIIAFEVKPIRTLQYELRDLIVVRNIDEKLVYIFIFTGRRLYSYSIPKI
jgi:hypothetical protein